MPYVSYDTNNNIVAVYANEQSFASTFLEATDPSVIAFGTPPLPDISPRQFYQQLAVQGLITQDEALAANNTIPSELAVLVSKLDQSIQFATKMKLLSAESFKITDSDTLAIASAYGWSPTQLQAFWTAASDL